MERTSVSKRIWFNILLFGFMGQLAWNVENVYFNTFLFNKIGGTTRDINLMVAASAATAVLTTFIMGAFSDRRGRRKPFVCAGYILWGITVTVFGFISRENTAKLFPAAAPAAVLAITVSAVIVMDCVMTFMGSTCNDAAFNAWITDVTDAGNRGAVESVNAILPVAATLLVTVGFGAGASALGYSVCFFILGAVVILAGIVGLFTLKDAPRTAPSDGSYLSELVYGLRPSVIRENRRLYLLFSAQSLANIAMQVVVPFIFIYLQHYLGFDFNSAVGVLTEKPLLTAAAAVGVVVFVLAVLFFGRLTDRVGRGVFLLPAVILQAAGLVLAFPMKNIFSFAAGFAVYGLGAMAFGVVMSAAVRDATPPDRVGAFQGVRMLFNVLLPMVIGPAVGSAVIERFASLHALGTYVNDYGESVASPVPEIFLAAAAVAALALIPVLFLRGKRFAENTEAEKENAVSE